MRLFQTNLTAATSQSFPDDLYDIELKLEIGNQLQGDSVFWFRPYLAADFPEITCDKKYFFIYSTDHAPTDGKISWGKGDNLDLSDFVEVGTIIQEYQSETPMLVRIENAPDDQKIHLFYHTNQSDPLNSPDLQQSKLLTTAGGMLSNNIWTDRGVIFPCQPGEDHTGYAKVWQEGNLFTALHLTNSVVSIQTYRRQTSTDGRTWTLQEIQDSTTGVLDPKYSYRTPNSWLFNYNGQNWGIGTVVDLDVVTIPGSGLNKNISVSKWTSNYKLDEQIKVLNGAKLTRNYEVYIDGNLAHIYFQDDDASQTVYYAKYDLRNLPLL